jgi:hypothetical protein
MLVVNLGCSPHFAQRGEIGFCQSCLSMRHRMPRRPCWQVKRKDVTAIGGLSKIDRASSTLSPMELVGVPRGVWGGSFVPRNALVSQKALVGSAVHQGTAFPTGHAIGGCFDHGDFVFRSAVAFMRSGEPFYEFGHARNMRSESVGCQPVGLPQSN